MCTALFYLLGYSFPFIIGIGEIRSYRLSCSRISNEFPPKDRGGTTQTRWLWFYGVKSDIQWSLTEVFESKFTHGEFSMLTRLMKGNYQNFTFFLAVTLLHAVAMKIRTEISINLPYFECFRDSKRGCEQTRWRLQMVFIRSWRHEIIYSRWRLTF